MNRRPWTPPDEWPLLYVTSDRLRYLHAEGSTWIALGEGGLVLHSAGGLQWQEVAPFMDHLLCWVGWRQGQFYAIGQGPLRGDVFERSFWASPDGHQWAPVASLPPEEVPLFRLESDYGHADVSRDGVHWQRIEVDGDERAEQILPDGEGAVLFVSDVMGYNWRLFHLDDRLEIGSIVRFAGQQEHVFAIGTDQAGRRLVGVIGYYGGVSIWAPDEA